MLCIGDFYRKPAAAHDENGVERTGGGKSEEGLDRRETLAGILSVIGRVNLQQLIESPECPRNQAALPDAGKRLRPRVRIRTTLYYEQGWGGRKQSMRGFHAFERKSRRDLHRHLRGKTIHFGKRISQKERHEHPDRQSGEPGLKISPKSMNVVDRNRPAARSSNPGRTRHGGGAHSDIFRLGSAMFQSYAMIRQLGNEESWIYYSE